MLNLIQQATAVALSRNLKTALKSLPQLQYLKLEMNEWGVAEQQAVMQALHAALPALAGLTALFLSSVMPGQQTLPLGSCQGLRDLSWKSRGEGVYGFVQSLCMAGSLTALTTLELHTQ